MTTQAQHTPGEWTVVPFLKDNNGKPLNFTVRSSEREIADVYNKPNTHGTEAETNAHLIAASPDLYEALKLLALDLGKEWCIDKYPIEHNGLTLLQIADAAIAKAEGR